MAQPPLSATVVNRTRPCYLACWSIVFVLGILPFSHPLYAAERVALLIGNQDYVAEVGPLENPLNDIERVGAALTQIGFDVTTVANADLGNTTRAINRYVRRLEQAGDDAIGFFYYSGHGAANPDTDVNYLIPVDVKSADEETLWDNSIRLKGIIDRLGDDASNATHFVVFDACRNELQLKKRGTKALGRRKGFRPERQHRGMLIAYATAPGELASDVGEGVGPYAEVLARELVKPGVEAVSMFREVQLEVNRKTGQSPWLASPALPRVYLAGRPQPITPLPEPGVARPEVPLQPPPPAPRAPRAGETKTEPVTGMTLAWMPPGCFQMGSETGNEEQRPVRRVCVEGFWLGKSEVTQRQWRQVMGDNPSNFKKGDDYPVEQVSWNDVQAFIDRLNSQGSGGFRLPSEAEWEYACRSGGRPETYCGGEQVDQVAWYAGNSERTTHPVGGKQANPLGLTDMSGNVWEWVEDCWHDNYFGAPEDGSPWLEARSGECGQRVIRGGSWEGSWDSGPRDVRSANRIGNNSGDRSDYLGFRLAQDTRKIEARKGSGIISRPPEQSPGIVYAECRRPAHGVERPGGEERWEADSGWREGGSSPTQYCGAQKLERERLYPDRMVTLLDTSEEHKTEHTPFKHDYYRYQCKFVDRWDTVYAKARSAACGTEE